MSTRLSGKLFSLLFFLGSETTTPPIRHLWFYIFWTVCLPHLSRSSISVGITVHFYYLKESCISPLILTAQGDCTTLKSYHFIVSYLQYCRARSRTVIVCMLVLWKFKLPLNRAETIGLEFSSMLTKASDWSIDNPWFF